MVEEGVCGQPRGGAEGCGVPEEGSVLCWRCRHWCTCISGQELGGSGGRQRGFGGCGSLWTHGASALSLLQDRPWRWSGWPRRARLSPAYADLPRTAVYLPCTSPGLGHKGGGSRGCEEVGMTRVQRPRKAVGGGSVHGHVSGRARLGGHDEALAVAPGKCRCHQHVASARSST